MNVVATALPQNAAVRSTAAPPAAKKQDADEFRASSPNKNDRGYEVAYNVADTLGTVTDIGSKIGQFYTIAGNVAGFEAGGLAGVVGLIGGTYDLARGASLAKQAAVNRDPIGSLYGSLQVVQGVATYGACLAPVFSALHVPGVGPVASYVALAAFVGKEGVKQFGKIKAKIAAKEREAEKAAKQAAAQSGAAASGSTASSSSGAAATGSAAAAQAPAAQAPAGSQAPAGPAPAPAIPGSQPAPSSSSGLASPVLEAADKSRKFENAYAFSTAVDGFARSIGGLASFWNVADGLMSGKAYGSLFGIPGLAYIGTTYTIAQGVAMTKHSAINRNKDGCVDGVLQTVQGLGALGTCLLGPAGMARIPAAIAAACWAGRIAYQVYTTAKKFGDKDGDKDGDKGKSLALATFQAVIDKTNPLASTDLGMSKAQL